MEELLRLAATMGLQVEERNAARLGGYVHATGLIRLNWGMSERVTRSVLAHELGHAFYGDAPSEHAPLTQRHERRANEWAAARLITAADYAAAEEMRDGHIGSMAFDLNVTVEIVCGFQRLLAREKIKAA